MKTVKKRSQKNTKSGKLKLPPDLEQFAQLVAQCGDDPDAALESHAIELIAELKIQSEASYGRLKRHLSALGAAMPAIEKLVRERVKAWRVEADADDKTGRWKGDASGNIEAVHIERLVLNDTTIERAAVIAQAQPRGIFFHRDELSGWLTNMSRYANGGSDRGFWIEGYGGRGYKVERMSRAPTIVDSLTVCVCGAIQPDKLNRLLLRADDDGMLSRFLPIWPLPVAPKRPQRAPDIAVALRAFRRLYELEMSVGKKGGAPKPVLLPFNEQAKQRMEAFMHWQRAREGEEAGLLISFLGKLRGIVARLSVVLALLDWAMDGAS